MTWYNNSEGRYGTNGAKGDEGEEIVRIYCEHNKLNYEHKIDPNSQVNLKIDFIINGVPVDVKSNYFKGYLGVELYNKRRENIGWIYSSTAKEIYGVDVETKSIYRYKVDDMIDYIRANLSRKKPNKFGDLLLWVPVKTEIIEQLQ